VSNAEETDRGQQQQQQQEEERKCKEEEETGRSTERERGGRGIGARVSILLGLVGSRAFH
jgi:hypothetical protein